MVFGADGFGQDDVEDVQDFVVDAARYGAQTVDSGGGSEVAEGGRHQSGFFFAFAAGGFKRGFAAGNAAADEVVEFVGIDGFVRAAAAYPKMPAAVGLHQSVEVDGLAHESERAEGGAFQRKENLARVVAHVKLFVAPAVQQSEAFPFVRQVLQTVAHRQPVVRLQAEVV